MNILLDEKLFSYVIMVLYVLNCIRWAIEGNAGQFTYWASAAAITYSVTFMIGK
jgi:hypothetical protein